MSKPQRRPGRKDKYPWRKWLVFKDTAHILRKGVDFQIATNSMMVMLRRRAGTDSGVTFRRANDDIVIVKKTAV